MDYKQKYEQALERCKEEFNFNNLAYSHDEIKQKLKRVFPELKESEDEKIRKSLIEHIKGITSWNYYLGISKEQMLAWLEKQGEQKTADKVEPKFKVGDWVVYCNEDVDLITGVGETGYIINKGGGYIPFDCEDEMRLWTIEDAKNGDVIASGEVVFIFKGIYGVWLYCHCSAHKDGSFNADSYNLLTNKYFGEVQPATKEQHDLLFQKMKEAGYEWDAEKKELKLI